jgi:hypothetical protein
MNSDAESVECSFRISPVDRRTRAGRRHFQFAPGEREIVPWCETETNCPQTRPKAWEEGFSAGENTARIPLRCPYPAGTTQAWSRHSGYVEGDAKRQGYSYSRGALSNGPSSRGPIIV